MLKTLVASLCLAVALSAPAADAEMILFESATLGETGQSFPDFDGTNISENVFFGVRFQLPEPVATTQVGGHFAGFGDFFGAIVQLDSETDIPNSSDLSTDDVRGATRINFPATSAEAFGDLSLTLDAGNYALVFGSGLFEASGAGGAPSNNTNLGDPTYLTAQPGFSSGFSVPINPIFDNFRFVLKGVVVPEPSSLGISFLGFFLVCGVRQRS